MRRRVLHYTVRLLRLGSHWLKQVILFYNLLNIIEVYKFYLIGKSAECAEQSNCFKVWGEYTDS